MRVASLMKEWLQDLARTVTLEEDTIIAEVHSEVDQASEIIIVLADEAKRLGCEVIPLDGAPGPGDRFGVTLRGPCRVVLFEARLRSLRTGNPPDEIFGVGPLARGKDAVRIQQSIRDGALVEPTAVTDVRPDMHCSCDELFGPVVDGKIHISWDTHSQADLMTYGGLKESGFRQDGRRYAVQEGECR